MYTVLNTKCYCMIRHFICNITQNLVYMWSVGTIEL